MTVLAIALLWLSAPFELIGDFLRWIGGGSVWLSDNAFYRFAQWLQRWARRLEGK